MSLGVCSSRQTQHRVSAGQLFSMFGYGTGSMSECDGVVFAGSLCCLYRCWSVVACGCPRFSEVTVEGVVADLVKVLR